jgi:hypothetical protein
MHLVLDEMLPRAGGRSLAEHVKDGLEKSSGSAQMLSVEINSIKKQEIADRVSQFSKEQVADEDARRISIFSRAQGLISTISILTALLATASALQPTMFGFGNWYGVIEILVIAYVLLQMMTLALHVFRSMSGLAYSKVSSRDVANWIAPHSMIEYSKREAIINFGIYRSASLTNTWRMRALIASLRALRNVILALVVLVFIFLLRALLPAPAHCENSVTIKTGLATKYYAGVPCEDKN